MKGLTCDVLKIKMLNIFRDILETEADLKPKRAPSPQTGGGRWLVVPEVSSCQKRSSPSHSH